MDQSRRRGPKASSCHSDHSPGREVHPPLRCGRVQGDLDFLLWDQAKVQLQMATVSGTPPIPMMNSPPHKKPSFFRRVSRPSQSPPNVHQPGATINNGHPPVAYRSSSGPIKREFLAGPAYESLPLGRQENVVGEAGGSCTRGRKTSNNSR